MGSSGIVGVTIGGVEFKPNRAGLRQVMRSQEIADEVGLQAEMIAWMANRLADAEPSGYHGKTAPRYGSRVKIQSKAAHGYAYTGNYAAMYDNAANDTLHRAI